MLVLVLADAAAAALPAVGDPLIDALMRGGPMGLMLAVGIVLMRQWTAWRAQERAADAARDAAAAQRDQARDAAAAQRDAARDAAAAQRDAERHALLREQAATFTSANERLLDRADRQNDRTVAAVADVSREVQAHVSREVQTLRGDVQALRTTQDRMLPVSVASGERRG